jgi:hypothetical protein
MARPNTSLLGVLLIVSLPFACRRGPEVTSGTTNEARVEAVGWKGQSYHVRNGRSAITLISADELEYRTDDHTILLCKYTDQGAALRVIVTALGTQQVMYFRRVPNGLMSNSGELYLNSDGWAHLRRQEEIEQQKQLKAAAAAAEARVAEEERLAALAEQEARRAAEAIDARFKWQGDGTIVDTESGLQWFKEPVRRRAWKDAVALCSALRVAQHNDWHMASRAEIETIVSPDRGSLIDTGERNYFRSFVDSPSGTIRVADEVDQMYALAWVTGINGRRWDDFGKWFTDGNSPCVRKAK